MYTLENLSSHLNHISFIESQPKFTGISAIITLRGAFTNETSKRHTVVFGDCGKESPSSCFLSGKYTMGDCGASSSSALSFKPSFGDCDK